MLKYSIIILLFVWVLLYSCGIKPGDSLTKLVLGNNVFIFQCFTSIIKPVKLSESSGIILCNKDEYRYTFGDIEYLIPLTLKEEFTNEFQGNYFVKFFNKIHIDSKVHRLFKDSVIIISLERRLRNDEKDLLFECSVCNMKALLKFRNNFFKFPYFRDTTQESSLNYSINVDTINGYYRKMWLSNNDSLSSGLLFVNSELKRQNKDLVIVSKLGKHNMDVKNFLLAVRPKTEIHTIE